MANLGEWRWGRGRRGSWKANICFVGEFHSQQSFLSFYFTWAKKVMVSAEGGLTCCSMGLGCLSCEILVTLVLETFLKLPPQVFSFSSTNSPVSLQSSFLSNILLQACLICKEYISSEGKPLWQGWQCSPLEKKDLMRKERVQAGLPFTFLLCKCFHNHQSWKLKVRSKRRIRMGERKQVVSLIVRFVDYGY